MPAAPTRPPLSRSARRALIVAILALVANVLFNAAINAMVGAHQPTTGVQIAQLVIVLVLAILAIVFGIRGVRDTADGRQRGRVRSVVAIVIGAIMIVAPIVVFVLTLLA